MAISESVGRKIALSYFYVLVWIVLSFSVIVFNKYILDRKLYNWPYPIRTSFFPIQMLQPPLPTSPFSVQLFCFKFLLSSSPLLIPFPLVPPPPAFSTALLLFPLSPFCSRFPPAIPASPCSSRFPPAIPAFPLLLPLSPGCSHFPPAIPAPPCSSRFPPAVPSSPLLLLLSPCCSRLLLLLPLPPAPPAPQCCSCFPRLFPLPLAAPASPRCPPSLPFPHPSHPPVSPCPHGLTHIRAAHSLSHIPPLLPSPPSPQQSHNDPHGLLLAARLPSGEGLPSGQSNPYPSPQRCTLTSLLFMPFLLSPPFPPPTSLTMIHMAFCSALAFLLVKVFRVVEPVALSTEMYLTSVLPIGALYSLSLWFSNSAYIYLSVSFIQVGSG
ncbi:unnamed protein product [Closterium sp. Naga37s-1]|nr:unnamed protein product [Closterium sp. Naga37s-1]